MRTALFVVFSLIVFSAQAQDPNRYDLFSTFTAMKNPQSYVPVGAKWMHGVGPVGDAEPATNLATTTGISSGQIATTVQSQFALSVASYLGLTARQARSIRVTFTDLSFTRVSDLTRLSRVRAGDQVIFQAVKAGTISIKAEQGTVATIHAMAIEKNLNVSIGIGGDEGSEIIIDGSNLFIAYQVLKLEPAKMKQITKTHNGDEITLANTYRIRFCQCDIGTPLTIEIQNLKAASPTGLIETKTISFNPVKERLREFDLEPVFTGESVIASKIRFKYKAQQRCVPLEGFERHDGSPVKICDKIVFPKDENKIVLTTTEFDIKPVKTPSGPY